MHIHEKQFETVRERLHIRVRVMPHLKGIGNDLDRPAAKRGFLTRFKAQDEVSWVLGIDAKGIHGPFRIGLGVGAQPTL